MYLFLMFVNIHSCALVLLFGTNGPYECRNNCQMFAMSRVIFYLFAISFFPVVKLKVPVHKIKPFLEENVTCVNQHQTCQRMLCILNLVEIIISRLSILWVRVMVFNTTFSNISVISWWLTFYSCIMFLPIVFNFIRPKFEYR